MSDVLVQVEELRLKAITLLLAERQAIDEKLATFGSEEGSQSRKRTSCKRCGQEGHTVRTCPRPEVELPSV
jgi:hypothetical protein